MRFAIIGVLSNLAGYLVYLLITSLGIGPKLALSILYPVGILLSYFGNRNWTFDAKGQGISSGARFFLAYGLGYVLNFLMLVIFVDRLGYAHQLVQAAAVIVVALFLFVATKFFVFPKSASQ